MLAKVRSGQQRYAEAASEWRQVIRIRTRNPEGCLGLAEGGPDLWDSYKALKIGEAIYDSAHGAGLVKIEY